MTLLRTKVTLGIEGAPEGVIEMALYIDTDVPDADAKPLAADAVRWLLSHDQITEEEDDDDPKQDD